MGAAQSQPSYIAAFIGKSGVVTALTVNKTTAEAFLPYPVECGNDRRTIMLKRQIVLTSIGCTMFAAAAIAQTSAPSTAPAAPATAPSATTAAPAPVHNLAGQGKWRASKLMGVDIYGPDNKKVGDVTEVVLDKMGKIEMITVGVGGFLGIGAKDVAIPFDQVTWSDEPIVPPAPAPAPAPSGGASSGASGGLATAPATMPAAPRAPAMYPDHGKITMTKDQLTAAPAVTYSGS